MSLAIYPTIRGLTWPVKKVPEFNTLEQQGPAGYRTATPFYQNPLWHWDLKYGYLNDDPKNILAGNTDTDYRTLLGFFLANKGVYGQWLFLDPADHHVGPGAIAGVPQLNSQLPRIQDAGGTWYSPLQRNLGGTGVNGIEDITDLVGGNIPASITLYENGAATSHTYSIGGPGLTVAGQSFEGSYVQWVGTPTGPITATFDFYFRCAFEKDEDVETDWILAAPNRYQAPSVKIKSVRAALQV